MLHKPLNLYGSTPMKIVDAMLALPPSRKKSLAPWEIATIAQSITGITWERIVGPERRRKIAYPRRLAFWIACDLGGYGWKEAGRLLGGKDHTTALYATEQARAGKLDPVWMDKARRIVRDLAMLREIERAKRERNVIAAREAVAA